jgi:uncharacterized protein (DUF2344 family)
VSATPQDWAHWVQQVLAQAQIWQPKVTKKGKSKDVDLRSRLFELSLVEADHWASLPDSVPDSVRDRLLQAQTQADNAAILRYVGSCRNDGLLLKPQDLVTMLGAVNARSFWLGPVHRVTLSLLPTTETTALET